MSTTYGPSLRLLLCPETRSGNDDGRRTCDAGDVVLLCLDGDRECDREFDLDMDRDRDRVRGRERASAEARTRPCRPCCVVTRELDLVRDLVRDLDRDRDRARDVDLACDRDTGLIPPLLFLLSIVMAGDIKLCFPRSPLVPLFFREFEIFLRILRISSCYRSGSRSRSRFRSRSPENPAYLPRLLGRQSVSANVSHLDIGHGAWAARAHRPGRPRRGPLPRRRRRPRRRRPHPPLPLPAGAPRAPAPARPRPLADPLPLGPRPARPAAPPCFRAGARGSTASCAWPTCAPFCLCTVWRRGGPSFSSSPSVACLLARPLGRRPPPSLLRLRAREAQFTLYHVLSDHLPRLLVLPPAARLIPPGFDFLSSAPPPPPR
jgi:hypothetical protein